MTGMSTKPPTPAKAPADGPGAGFSRVRWVYHPDTARMGKVVDLPTDEAQRLKAENRVAYVDQTTPVDVDGDGRPLPAAVASVRNQAPPAGAAPDAGK